MGPSSQLISLSEDTVNDLHSLFSRNLDRLADDSIAILVEEPEWFIDEYSLVVGDPLDQWFLIQDNDKTIGTIEVYHQGEKTRLGYLIDEDYEGRGIMRHWLGVLISEQTSLVEARIHKDNKRSQRLVESFGFVQGPLLQDDHCIWRKP